MAVVSGVDGNITFANGYTVKVQGWTLSIEADASDTTGWSDYDDTSAETKGDSWDTFIGGRKRWSGSYNAVFDPATAPYSDTTPLGWQAGASSAVFIVDEASTTPGQFTGDIIVTGIEAGTEISGVAALSFTFQGTGNLAFQASAAV